jgi:hypothetical protein
VIGSLKRASQPWCSMARTPSLLIRRPGRSFNPSPHSWQSYFFAFSFALTMLLTSWHILRNHLNSAVVGVGLIPEFKYFVVVSPKT